MRPRIRSFALLVAMLPLGLALPACEVTPEKIQLWKETEKGPQKLREALRSSSVSTEVRADALTALVEIGMASDAVVELKELPDGTRRDIVSAAAGPLIAMAQSASSGAPAGGDAGPKRKMRDAKDALFMLRDWAGPGQRAAIDDALIAWTTVDLAGRMSAGSKSSEQILLAIGARAAPRLAAVIADETSAEPSRHEAAALLGRIDDRTSREQAGSRLVEKARQMKRLDEPTLQMVGLVGGDHAVAWLTSLAEDPKVGNELREKALFALALTADPAALPTALRLAGDRKADGNVREAAFQLAEKIGPPAVPGLAKLLDDKNDIARWRAVEATLAAGKAQAIPTVLEGLATTRAYSKDDVMSYIVHDLTLIGPSALGPLREQLKSKSWVARLVAVEGIGTLGKADDAPALEDLGADETKLKGWPGGVTLGTQARAMASLLRAR